MSREPTRRRVRGACTIRRSRPEAHPTILLDPAQMGAATPKSRGSNEGR